MHPTDLSRGPQSLTLTWPDGQQSEFHHLWLRDNCRCPDCLHPVTAERLLFTADIPADVAPDDARLTSDGWLEIVWPAAEGGTHRSQYPPDWLLRRRDGTLAAGDRSARRRLWGRELADDLPTFEHAAVLASDGEMLRYLEAIRDYGFALLRGVPTETGEVERFANRIAYVREIVFDRIHEVYSKPDAYNVAQTAVMLRPHTDLPSYSWPPSIQLLHCLAHEAEGGDSVVVDGFHVAELLRARDPAAYDMLARTAVPFRLFDAQADTFTRAPMLEHDQDGTLRVFRYSNQLMQPVELPAGQVSAFYDAYRQLARLIDDPANQAQFRLGAGDLYATHNHRVMHGRKAFDPNTGFRHLQDVYMEFDDILGRIRVLRGAFPGARLHTATQSATG